METILAVDTNILVHELATAEWAKVGVGTLRVDTMHDAIKLLLSHEVYLFVAINEDSIPDFFSQLPIMRNITATPIFVITSSYSTEKKVRAIEQGANVYDPFSDNLKDNVLGGLALLKAQKRRINPPLKSLPLIGGNVLLPLNYRNNIFVNDTKVTLTSKEFDILHYLLLNQRITLSYGQIINNVWNEEYGDAGSATLWGHIKKIRKKNYLLPLTVIILKIYTASAIPSKHKFIKNSSILSKQPIEAAFFCRILR